MTDQAPLAAIAEAPVPDNGTAEWFSGAGAHRLRAASFFPNGKARGSVVLSPGRTEVIEKYFEVVQDLLDRGFAVVVHDWRGQGLSHRALPDRLKGHAAGFSDFMADYHALLAAFEERLPKPWIAMGHSMGGGLTLAALAHGQARRFKAAILSAPMAGLRTPGLPKRATRALAWVMAHVGLANDYVLGDPGLPFCGPFEGNILTHDPARYARMVAQLKACPDLALGAPTWGWLDFAFSLSSFLKHDPRVAQIDIPVVALGAAEEALVDNADQRAVIARIPRGRWIEVAGSYHEILQETDEVRAVFWGEFDRLADAVLSQ